MPRIHSHVPYPRLPEYLDLILSQRLDIEIFFSAESLDGLDRSILASQARLLSEHGIRTTIHGPFMDLNPGSFEPRLREATIYRFNQALDAAELLRPSVMVFHPGYDRWRYGESRQRWFDLSLEVWKDVVRRGEGIGTIIAVENIFEEEPSTLRELLRTMDSPFFRHCFDVGHWNLFGTVGLTEWFAEVGGFIAETHVHDNFGTKDDHLPVGEGEIDFDLFFSLMGRFAPDAVHTLEAHTLERLERSRREVVRRLTSS